MTLLLLLEATDGLLAISDGRITRTEPDGNTYPLTDHARKGTFTPGASIVAMASGRMNFADQDVATVFKSALVRAVSIADASGGRLSVKLAAKACFDALNKANEAHEIPEHGVMALVAGFDETEDAAQVYEFTVPDTGGGPQPSLSFLRDRFLALPVHNDTSDLVGAKFGLLTTDQYCQRLDDSADDPTTDFLGQFSLAGQDLRSVEAAVTEILPAFLATDFARLDREGVGGQWLVFRVRPDCDVEQEPYAWGPMRASVEDSPGP